jgi:hypothetical protein
LYITRVGRVNDSSRTRSFLAWLAEFRVELELRPSFDYVYIVELKIYTLFDLYIVRMSVLIWNPSIYQSCKLITTLSNPILPNSLSLRIPSSSDFPSSSSPSSLMRSQLLKHIITLVQWVSRGGSDCLRGLFIRNEYRSKVENPKVRQWCNEYLYL